MWLADGQALDVRQMLLSADGPQGQAHSGRSSGWCVPMGTGAPALAPKPTAPGERPVWAHGAVPRPVAGRGARRCSAGWCPASADRAAEEAAVCHAEEEADRRGAEAEDQDEAFTRRRRDELPVGAGEDPDQPGPGAEQVQAVEDRRDEGDQRRAPGSPPAGCPGAGWGLPSVAKRETAVLGRIACAMGHLLREGGAS